MENITIGQIVGAFGILSAIYAFISSVTKPIRTFENRVKAIEQHQDTDNKRLKEQEQDLKTILRTEIAILQHMIDGDHVDDCRKLLKEVQDYLIEK